MRWLDSTISRIGTMRFAWWLLLIAAVAIYGIAEHTQWDMALADYYFDFAHRRFPLKRDWLYDDFFHEIFKFFLIALNLSLLLLIFLDAVKYLPLGAWSRLRLRFVWIASLCITTSIAWLKSQSAAHCPWDITRYGGDAPMLPVFTALFSNLPTQQAGHCFPAGHASSGLWLAAFCVFYLPASPKKALGLFMTGLSIGLLLGWAQQVRGAHFLSHTLSSAWLASFIILCLLMLYRRKLLATHS